MLVSATEMLNKAKAGHYAVGQFNINNLEWTKAILQTAQELNSPVILGVSEGAGKYMCGFKTVTAMVDAMVDELGITVPVALHLDHGSYEGALKCIEAGFSSVMFDGSALPLPENIARTAEIAALAHAAGISIEAELGHVGYPDRPSHGTDPAEVAQFLHETRIDALAISIGNSHLMTTRDAAIDLARLHAIQTAAPSLPLVLHGGSGLAPALRRQLAHDTTVAKFNIGTELRQAFGTALRATLADHPDRFDRIQILRETIDPVTKAARQIIANLA